MRKFQSHKIVEAMKIRLIQPGANGHFELVGELGSEIVVDRAYLEKHRPEVGGYYVRYAGGYESWSPAKDFEEGYRELRRESVAPVRYTIDPKEQARLLEVFTYHAPQGDQVERYAAIRAEAYALACRLCELVPAGRERALALTHLEEAVMFANAGIARGEVLRATFTPGETR